MTDFAEFVKGSSRMWLSLTGQNKKMVLHSQGNWKPPMVFKLEGDMIRVAFYED